MISTYLKPPPLDLELAPNEIHIWHARLDQPQAVSNRLIQLLSKDERSRAGRFHFEQDRTRFIARRGILRTILGTYLDVEPHRLQFYYEKNGKPRLADIFDKERIHFNDSHSAGLAIIAISPSFEIGVDVERVHDIPEMNDIVEKFFTESEKTSFYSLRDGLKQEVFFKWWTRKEAFLKATGDGLFRPLNSFDMSVAPGEPTSLLRIYGDAKAASRWAIQDLKPPPGYAAAFAIKEQSCQVHCYKWSD